MVIKAFLKVMPTRNKKKGEVPMGCRTDSLSRMVGTLEHAKDHKNTNVHPSQYQHFFPTATGAPLM